MLKEIGLDGRIEKDQIWM